ncbi:MAG: adenosylcobinamide-GDP ribazoletransferase [Desulfobacterales bacterium]|nr:adenosylcobinamide-GDP ribazoletransferase [Desulfobacterales bacterium]
MENHTHTSAENVTETQQSLFPEEDAQHGGAKRDPIPPTRGWLTDLRSCFLFISILPAGRGVAYSPVGMIKFFPVVGLVIGMILGLTDLVASQLWTPAVVALVDVLVLVSVTGAFHLDGLGDTADGIFSHRPRERALEIMKDSRTGMMGLVAVVVILALKFAGIYSVKSVWGLSQTLLLLVIVPAYARASMIFGIKIMKYGRKNTGTGLDLFENPLGNRDFIFALIPLFLSLFLGYKGALVLNILFFTALGAILMFYKKKMNCITGDMLGAMTEMMEAILFLGCGIAPLG